MIQRIFVRDERRALTLPAVADRAVVERAVFMDVFGAFQFDRFCAFVAANDRISRHVAADAVNGIVSESLYRFGRERFVRFVRRTVRQDVFRFGRQSEQRLLPSFGICAYCIPPTVERCEVLHFAVKQICAFKKTARTECVAVGHDLLRGRFKPETKFYVAVGHVTLGQSARLAIESAADHNADHVFAFRQIIRNVILHAVDAVAHAVVQRVRERQIRTRVVVGNGRHEFVRADALSVDIQHKIAQIVIRAFCVSDNVNTLRNSAASGDPDGMSHRAQPNISLCVILAPHCFSFSRIQSTMSFRDCRMLMGS